MCTSGNGLIGSNLNYDFAITRKICDLADSEQVNSLFDALKPDTVIHAGGNLQPSYSGEEIDHYKIFRNNVLGDLNVVQASINTNVQNLLMLSSASAYPSKAIFPVKENALYEGSVGESHYGYGVSKRFNLELSKITQMSRELNIKSIILGNIYGPGEKISMSGTVVGQLIFKILQAKTLDLDLLLPGSGLDRRNFTYVRDLDYIFNQILFSADVKEPINVANPLSSTVFQITEILRDLLDFKKQILFKEILTSSYSEKTLDTSAFQKLFPDYGYTNLQEGLTEMVSHVLSG